MLAETFHHGVDVVAGAFADAGDDQCPRRDLAQFLAVQHGAAAQLTLEQWRGRPIYVAVGFDPSPAEPMTLMVTLGDIRRLLE